MFTLDRLENRQFLSAVLVDGTLTITGTDAGEKIWVELAKDGRVRAAIDQASLGLFKADQVLRIVMDGRGGADHIENRLGAAISATLLGGHGNDYISGGGGTDYVHGGPGNDEFSAGAGDDTIIGGSGDDTIWGGQGRDLINGSTGNDLVRTDGNDSIHYVENIQPEVLVVPIPTFPSELLEIGLQQSGSSAQALLDFTFSDTGFRVDIRQVRRVGNQIRISLQLGHSLFNHPAITEKRVTVPLGNLPAGKYVISVQTSEDATPITKAVSLGR